jgi:hypothetical protein
MNKIQKVIEESGEEFDKKRRLCFVSDSAFNDVKSFLLSRQHALLDAVKEEIKEIRNEKVTFPKGADMNMPYNQMLIGYNQALQDIINILTTKE